MNANEKTTVQVDGVTVVIDRNLMKFNEMNLGEYLQNEYGYLDYFGKQHELAQNEYLIAECDYELLKDRAFITAKEEGCTDTLAKAKAASDVKVVEAYKKSLEKKLNAGLLKSHLNSWYKNHENAQNRGYTLRKEIDKMNSDIYVGNSTCQFDDFASGK